MKNKIILIAAILMLVTGNVACAQSSHKLIGGPCEYDKTQGTCQITSVAKTDGSIRQAKTGGGPGYEGYEIKYRFKPNGQDVLDKEHTLQLANSWYPGEKFLEKYKIAQGKTFNCAMLTIKKGTCSPVVFEFPDIDTTDYFETQR